MARLYIPAERIKDEQITLQPKEARYIFKVLRLGPGDKVMVFDGEGGEYLAEICEDYQGGVYLVTREEVRLERESPLKITLGQALLKGEKMKFVIQKATELGAHRIVPITTSRSVPILQQGQEVLRVQRWRKIAQEAAKQCGRSVVPHVEQINELEAFLSQGAGAKLILWEEEPTSLREVLAEITPSSGITLLIGPEGGFSEDEVSLAQAHGFIVAGLGERILRAETAVLSVLSILQHLFGDLG